MEILVHFIGFNSSSTLSLFLLLVDPSPVPNHLKPRKPWKQHPRNPVTGVSSRCFSLSAFSVVQLVCGALWWIGGAPAGFAGLLLQLLLLLLPQLLALLLQLLAVAPGLLHYCLQVLQLLLDQTSVQQRLHAQILCVQIHRNRHITTCSHTYSFSQLLTHVFQNNNGFLKTEHRKLKTSHTKS